MRVTVKPIPHCDEPKTGLERPQGRSELSIDHRTPRHPIRASGAGGVSDPNVLRTPYSRRGLALGPYSG